MAEDKKEEIREVLDGKFTNSDGKDVTINPTKDPKYPGGSYASVGDSQDHTTYVKDSDGNIKEVKKRGKG